MTDIPPIVEPCVEWTLSAGDVVVEVMATMNAAGEIVFTYELISGVADLNGLYLDLNNDGGTIRKLDGGNNMNGSDSDGDRLDGFDWAKIIGTVGGSDADTTSGSRTMTLAEMASLGITSLADLDGAEVGIRATSVGEDREDSLKLADTGTYCEPEEPVELCDRPVDGMNVAGLIAMQDAQITELTFIFFIPPVFESTGMSWPGDENGDGYYTVTISVPAEMAEDPDAYLDELTALLMAENPTVAANPILKSVIVTDCHGNLENYAIALDENGELTDPLVGGAFGVRGGVLPADIDLIAWSDATYDLAITSDGFEFV